MPTNQIINDVMPWTQAIASTNQTVFDTNWTAAYATDIVVYQRSMNEWPDELTQVLLESEYNVTFIGTGQMVRVTLINPAANGDIITIVRDTPVDRLNLYTNTNFVPSMLNQDTALLTLVDQERQMMNLLSVKYHISGLNPNFSATDNPPVVPLGPNQVWAMDPTGNFIIAYNVPEGGGIAPEGAKYIIQQPNSNLPNAQAMSSLTTGFVVSNTVTGVQVTRVIDDVTHQTVVINGDGASGNASIGIAPNPILPGTAGMGIPSGTTAERVMPTPPSIGFRFNTDIQQPEAYIDGQWVMIPSSEAGLFLPLIGGTMAGIIDMDGNIIDGLPLPTTDNEAASKIYVDNAVGGAAGGVTGNMQWNNGGTFSGDPNFNTDGAGTIEIDGSLRVDNILIDGNRISAVSGLVEIEDGQLFNALDANSNKVENLAICTVGTDAANKNYVDATAAGRHFVAPVRASATANFSATYSNGTAGVGATLTATVNGAAALDGITLALNDRELFPFQDDPIENGIYICTDLGSVSTPAVYTRADDYDTPSDIDPGDIVGVTEGTIYSGAFWMETAIVASIGTDPITFILSVNPNVVTLDTTQTITGAKAFTAPMITNDFIFNGSQMMHSGDTDNYFEFGTDIQNFVTGNSSRMDITDNGVRLGGANSRVTTILDEDDMISDSDTALATQQSIKSYVDNIDSLKSVQVITSSIPGMYTLPAGIKTIVVEVLGGGGGGGAGVSGTSTLAIGGGGGAGGYAKLLITSPSSTYSLVIGAGGAGGNGATPGQSGGSTTFGPSLVAAGGQGGFNGISTALAAGSTVMGGVGGAAVNGNINSTGAPGGGGVVSLGFGLTGQGASSMYGGGGRGTNIAGDGVSATGLGAGGSGAFSYNNMNYTGGNGSLGLIIVWEYA